MPTMPDRAVLPVAFALIVCAVVGLALGFTHAGPPGGDDSLEGQIVPAVTPVSSAQAIAAPTSAMDEATVRRMAREEATALLAARAAPKKPKAAAPDADQTDDATPPGGEVTPLIPPPTSPSVGGSPPG